jgi:hypothetical protein
METAQACLETPPRSETEEEEVMPFKKVKGGYRSPSGRKMTAAQVRAYYAKQGKKKRTRKR